MTLTGFCPVVGTGGTPKQKSQLLPHFRSRSCGVAWKSRSMHFLQKSKVTVLTAPDFSSASVIASSSLLVTDRK